MRTLIIHHLEPCWETGYKSFGTCFQNLLWKFAHHLETNQYDQIILTRFEDHTICPEEYEPIYYWINQVHAYSYGWEAEELEEYPDRFCEGGNHSEAVLIEDWMKELTGEVYISGAFDGECVEDLEIALRHCGINFKRIEELIV